MPGVESTVSTVMAVSGFIWEEAPPVLGVCLAESFEE